MNEQDKEKTDNDTSTTRREMLCRLCNLSKAAGAVLLTPLITG